MLSSGVSQLYQGHFMDRKTKTELTETRSVRTWTISLSFIAERALIVHRAYSEKMVWWFSFCPHVMRKTKYFVRVKFLRACCFMLLKKADRRFLNSRNYILQVAEFSECLTEWKSRTDWWVWQTTLCVRSHSGLAKAVTCVLRLLVTWVLKEMRSFAES